MATQEAPVAPKTREWTRFGRYALLNKIGSGGMAEIYRAKTFGAAGFEKEFAIKLILPNLIDDMEFLDMFINEAKISVNLYHANIVQVFDLGQLENQYYIAMEFVRGKDLLDCLVRCAELKIKIPLNLVLFITMEMLKGLDFAHRAKDPYGEELGIIHRDVSPSNILISYAGDVKVGDFGVAKAAYQCDGPESGTLKGKVGYMSPEQVVGEEIDWRSDIFAAGIIFFEALSMNRLFVGPSDVDIMLRVRDADIDSSLDKAGLLPASLEAIVRKALHRDKFERYQTAGEFYQALVDFCFENNIKVTGSDLSNFMRRVFARDIEEEKKRRRTESTSLFANSEVFLNHDSDVSVALTSSAEHFQPTQVTTPTPGFQDIRVPQSLSVESSDSAVTGRYERLNTKKIKSEYASYEGQLSEASFARLLTRLHRASATGRLHVKSGDVEKSIFMQNGEPVFVESNRDEELLGYFLISHNLITQSQLSRALARLSEWGGRLGDALVTTGAVPADKIFQYLVAQMREKLLEVFSWDNGYYGYYENQEPEAHSYSLGVDSYDIIVNGCRQRTPLVRILSQYAAIKNQRFGVNKEHHQLPDTLPLSREERKLHSTLLATPTTLQQLLAGVSEDWREIVYRAVYLLHQMEIIEPVDDA